MLAIDDELRGIFREIVAQNWSDADWATHEADDWFQTAKYCGGFDATENEFCFSVNDADSAEWWFQFPLSTVAAILSGDIKSIECHAAT